jgi:anti-sigma B factor antagonist
MNITLEHRNGGVLLRFHDERVDAHNSSELKDYLSSLLEEGMKCLVLDMAEVGFVDSSGLGALLSGFKNAGLRECRFVLAALQPRVQSMFELTRLHRVFEIHPSVSEALCDAGENLHESAGRG